VIVGLVEKGRQPESIGSLPNLGASPSTVHVARRAATLTERLCGLYVMVTMNMDFTLIRYLIESGELKNWLKQCLEDEPACPDPDQI